MLEKPGAARRINAPVERRDLAPPRLRALPRRVPAWGRARLQRLLFEHLDADLTWLATGPPVLERGTGNPLTTGIRFHPEG